MVLLLICQEESPVTLDEVSEVADMPVLIIWGEEDTWVPITMGEAMNSSFTDVEMVTYESVGHLPMEENVEQFNTDMISFLSKN